ncbi:MAG: bifunctional hydroxymethylpyrimidine kinase/phosphomethylpyrimidine kinase [Methanomassiliicoccales archaeon]
MSTVLTIAGTDSIGGAGVAADLKAFASMDLHGCCVITAVTSQNTQQVSDILPMPVRTVASQLDAVFDDLKIDAVKTGMIYSAEIAEVIARKLSKEDVPLVIDPVLCAGVGSLLFREDLKASLFTKLFPLATVVTPNRMEAEEFSSTKILDVLGSEEACRAISASGARGVLLKGGHFEGPMVTDMLLHDNILTEFTSPRLPIKVHGSGCTLSSYIAGYLAKGCDLRHAVAGSKRRMQDAIAMSSRLGKGMAIVNPMATKQKEAMRYPRIESLRQAVGKMEVCFPPSLVPETGLDFVYALPNPQDFFEICWVEGKIQKVDDRLKRGGDVVFGTSSWISRAIMLVNIEHPELLAGLELGYSKQIEGFFRDQEIAGMVVMSDDSGYVVLMTEDGTNISSEQLGLVPDALFKSEGMGKEPRIGIIGKDPDDILRKIGRCLDGMTR